MGGSSYAYDGAGNRISQTVGVDVTQYLLDLQPGLATVLQATQDTDTTRYIHAQRGIHAQQDASDNWAWMLQDGLGSVRSVVDDSLSVLESRMYEPYGVPFGGSGTNQTVYGFTGELVDGNDLLYLRARYYAPNLGVFTGLDLFEGKTCSPMSLNGYGYVAGNVVNAVDPSGMIYELPSMWDSCSPALKPIGGKGGKGGKGKIRIPGSGNFQQPICLIDPDNPVCINFPLPPNPIAELCEVNSALCDNNSIQRCPSYDPYCWLSGSLFPEEEQTPIAGLTDDELSILCKAGRGTFNEACQELLRRCNDNPRSRACGLRSTCDRDYEDRLNEDAHSRCDSGTRCEVGDSCATLYAKVLQNLACISARWDVADQCYQGRMDNNHLQQISDANTRINRCTRFILAPEQELKQFGATREPCYAYWDSPMLSFTVA